MAEVVFQNMESMIPELEELEKMGIFTKKEIKIVIKKRRNFEYKLRKRVKCRDDFMNYIEYELALDKLRFRRAKKLKLKNRSVAALSIKNRIHLLYRRILLKFGDDLKLWTQYIAFCKKTKSGRQLSLAFGKLVQRHCSNADVWILAAKHEVTGNGNMNAARTILQKGLRQNKDLQILWLQLFRLELQHVEKLREKQNILGKDGIELTTENDDEAQPKNIDEFLSHKTAMIVYKNAIHNFEEDLALRMKFVDILDDFDNVDSLQDFICESISTDFADNEDAIELTCRKSVRNLSNDNEVTDEEWELAESKTIEDFEKAIDRVNTLKMWEKYMQCFGELLQASTTPQQTQRRVRHISNIVKNAEKMDKMSEPMYVMWTELMSELAENDEEIFGYLSTVLKRHSRSVELWKRYLILKTQYSESWDELTIEFKTALSSVSGQDDLVLWQMYVDTSESLEYEKAKEIYEEILNSNRTDLKNFFLHQYIGFAYSCKGIEEFRKIYLKLMASRLQKDFIKTCLSLEEEEFLQSQTKKRKNLLKYGRKLHEYQVDYYGKKDPDVWIAYIEFERLYNATDIERCGKIYNKAKGTLVGSLNSEFISKFTMLQSS